MSELFLRSTPDRDQNMRRVAFLDERQKVSIFDFQSVLRRDQAIADLDGKSFPARPIQQFLLRAFAGQDPEDLRIPFAFQLCEQLPQISKTGNAANPSTSQQLPSENHQTAVSNRQVCRQDCAAIRFVFAQSCETCPGRRNQKTALCKHPLNCFIDLSIKKTDAENLL